MRLLLFLMLLSPPLAAQPCTLYPQGKFDCRGRGLRHIPSLPVDILHLDLSNNSIHVFKPPVGTFPHLHLLNLSHNPLHSLRRNAFHNLPGLRTLDLTDCRISRLQSDALNGIDNLQTLVLRQNNVKAISLKNLPDVNETSLSPSPLFTKTWRHNLRYLLARAGLCDCSSGRPLSGHDPGGTGLFCSCHSGPVPDRPEAYTVHARFIRDVTEISSNETSSNLTSASTPVAQSRSWPYLVGFVLGAIFLSCLIALAAKFNILHKYLSSYRHRPLPENEWVSEAQSELPGLPISPPEDEDGFIEDTYIQPREHHEDEEDIVIDGMYSI